jgi:hypothetical protein
MTFLIGKSGNLAFLPLPRFSLFAKLAGFCFLAEDLVTIYLILKIKLTIV